MFEPYALETKPMTTQERLVKLELHLLYLLVMLWCGGEESGSAKDIKRVILQRRASYITCLLDVLLQRTI